MVGDFADPELAASVVSGASSVVTTVHPMGSDRATQQRIGVEGTLVVARAAVSAGIGRLIHISTAAVYDRSPRSATSTRRRPWSATTPATTRSPSATPTWRSPAWTASRGCSCVPGHPRAGPTSVWNTLRPAAMREDEQARSAIADATFPWVHVADLASLAADLASGRIPNAADPASGPVADACIPLNVAAAPATQRDYYEVVTGALGVDPVWEEAPAWTGRILADRARGWGWAPTVDLAQASHEIAAGLRAGS